MRLEKIALTVAVTAFLLAGSGTICTASDFHPYGVCGNVTVDGEPIDDGYIVTIENENGSDEALRYTDNGSYVASIEGENGDTLTASIEYEGETYSNQTTIDNDSASQWCNISISTSSDNNGDDNESDNDDDNEEENTKPVIDIPETFQGKTGNETTFDGSDCYDEDGTIVEYEWTFYARYPFTLRGEQVEHEWDSPCDIMGVLTVYDDDSGARSQTFGIHVEETTSDEEDGDNDNNGNDSDGESNGNETPNANFTVEGALTLDEPVYFNSTSEDPDGFIGNRTWTIAGRMYYGETVEMVPREHGINETGNVTATLVVTDDDGLMDEYGKDVTLNESEGTIEYNVTLDCKEDVNLRVYDEDDELVDEDSGSHFEYTLPSGSYEVVYDDGNNQYSEVVALDGNKSVTLPVNSGGGGNIPLGGAVTLTAMACAVMIVYMVRRKQ